MVYLLLSIFFSACLPLLLRGFAAWRVSVMAAVCLNYLVCVIVGTLCMREGGLASLIQMHPWTLAAAVQGGILAGNFYLLAFTAQRAGVSVAALASRLSVAIPIILAIPLYGDRLRLVNGAGVLVALAALVLASTAPPDPARSSDRRPAVWLPVVVFFAFGFHFALLKYVQHTFLTRAQHHDYLTTAFLFALLTSSGTLLLVQRRMGPVDWSRSTLGGGFLGAINYAALFSLTRLLSVDGWSSAVIFPTYSVGVVIVSSLGAVALFAERLSPRRLTGIGIGMVAVVMLNL